MTETSDPRDGDSNGSRDYEVGRGRPPVHSRFKPGNKLGRGRPAGSPNARTAFNAAFATKRSVTIDGKVRKVSRGEIAMEQLANQSAKGDLKAIGTYLAYADKWPDEGESHEVPQHQQEQNLKAIDSLLELHRLAQEGLGQGGDE